MKYKVLISIIYCQIYVPNYVRKGVFTSLITALKKYWQQFAKSLRSKITHYMGILPVAHFCSFSYFLNCLFMQWLTVVCDSSYKTHFYGFTDCQVCFDQEAAKSTGKINMPLNDLSFTATSTCHFSCQFDWSLTLKKSKDVTCNSVTPLSFHVYMWKSVRQREKREQQWERCYREKNSFSVPGIKSSRVWDESN